MNKDLISIIKNEGLKTFVSMFGQVLAYIFHYTETWTNIVATTVAWSNVPKTVAK